MSVRFVRKELDVDGLRWRWFVAGEGRPLVLLPGFATSPKTLMSLGRRLAEQWQVFLPELPGFSFDPPLPLEQYRLSAQVELLASWAAALGLDDLVLGGNSAGGQLAVLYALAHPEQVDHLLLFAPQGAGDHEYHPYSQKTNPPDSIKEVEADLKRLYFTPPKLDRAALAGLLAKQQRQWALLNQIRLEIQAEPAHHLNHLLPTLNTPTLLIWGEEDGRLPVRLSKIWQELCPNLQLHRLPHCAHLPQVEQTPHCLDLIQSFLDG